MRMIAEIVTDVPRWSATLDDWQSHDWKPTNVPGMIGKYQGDREAIKATGWPRRNGQPATNEPKGFAAIREAMEDPRYKAEEAKLNGNVS